VLLVVHAVATKKKPKRFRFWGDLWGICGTFWDGGPKAQKASFPTTYAGLLAFSLTLVSLTVVVRIQVGPPNFCTAKI